MKFLFESLKIGASATAILIIAVFIGLVWLEAMKMFLTTPFWTWLFVVAIYAILTWMLWRVCKWLGGVIHRNTQRDRELGERLRRKLAGHGDDRPFMIAIVLFAALCQMPPASAEDDYLLMDGIIDGPTPFEQAVMDEVLDHIVIPCFTEAVTDRDADRARRIAENHKDKLPQWSAIYLHTPESDIRMAAYPAWKDECLHREANAPLASTATPDEIKKEAWEHYVFPCFKAIYGSRDNAVNAMREEITEVGRDEIDGFVDTAYSWVKATESKDTRMAAYQVMLNSCMAIR